MAGGDAIRPRKTGKMNSGCPPYEKSWFGRISGFLILALLWASIIGYAFFFTARSIHFYRFFTPAPFDLGIFDQAVWLISHGRTPFVTVRGVHILADHFSAILYLVAPIYRIWDSPEALLAIQSMAMALGALPAYGIVRKLGGSGWLALLFADAYLLYPPTQWTCEFDFHPDALAVPMLLAAVYFLFCGRWGWYFAMLALAALCKETIGLTILFLGFYALLVSRRIALLTMAFGIISLAIAMSVIYHFNHGEPSGYISYYSVYGSSLPGIAWNLVTHPCLLFAPITSAVSRIYYLHLLQPVAFLPLAAPELLLPAIPALLSNLLSSKITMHYMPGYYTAAIIPFVISAALTGMNRIRKWGRSLTFKIVVTLQILASLNGLWNGPLSPKNQSIYPGPTCVITDAERMKREIPSNASVSAQTDMVPHFDHRRLIYTFPNPFYKVAWGNTREALNQEDMLDYPPYSEKRFQASVSQSNVEYILLTPSGAVFPLTKDIYQKLTSDILRCPDYGIIDCSYGTILLRHGANHLQGLTLLAKTVGVPCITDQNVTAIFCKYLLHSL